MVLVDFVIVYFSLKVLCRVGDATIFLCDKTLGKQTIKYKSEPTGPLSPCGQYEQVGWGDALMWADVGNDL